MKSKVKKVTIGDLLSCVIPEQKILVVTSDGKGGDTILYSGKNILTGQEWEKETYYWMDFQDDILRVEV